MKINVKRGDISKIETEVLLIPVYQKLKKPTGLLAVYDQLLKGLISDLIRSGEISGSKKNVTIVHGQHTPAKKIIVVGLGEREKVDLAVISACTLEALKKVEQIKAAQVVTSVFAEDVLGFIGEQSLRAMIEAVIIGLYKFKGIKKKEDENNDFKISEITFISGDQRKVTQYQRISQEILVIAQAVNYARDLVNLPSNVVTPTYLAREARNLAAKYVAVKTQVYSEAEIKKMKLNSLLAVAKGSDEPCRLVVIKYNGGKGEPLGLVGKGITFDSGGISLKDRRGMKEMISDMGGAASILAVIKAAAELKIKKNVIAVIPLAENLPSGRAQKPGDVITAANGKTIEVLNTDAEGRLVLADGLVLAQKLGAKKIIDLATLTGACIIALGHLYTGVMGNDQKWIDLVLGAAVDAGEKFWQLPLDKEYRKLLKSSAADISNCVENGEAGAITGGIFLQEFIENEVSWVHCDIAGTSYLKKREGLYQKGATGAGIKTVLEVLLK